MRWLAPYRGQTVTVGYAPTTQPTWFGTSEAGLAMVLQLDRAGFDVQMPVSERPHLDPRFTDHVARARAEIVVAFADGGSPPPGPGEQFLGSSGRYQIYGVALR